MICRNEAAFARAAAAGGTLPEPGGPGLLQPGIGPDAEQHERAAARDAPERERARAGGGGK